MEIKPDINKYTSSKAFYESRYQTNYMDSWPEWKKERIKKLIEGFNLPPKGSLWISDVELVYGLKY